ncbi:MAG: autophagy protein 17 [Chrysothrix sp. TS-e1954]|nr:MAG: autophagy protein 17 [Chrysothrix sp. TS-e1954]
MLTDDAEDGSSTSSQDASSSTSSLQNSEGGRPILERLVRHFVAAKRALSATHHVWRANRVVASSKVALEDIVTLDAKNHFLKSGVDRQLHNLRKIHYGLALVASDGHADFKTILARLDEADAKVKDAIHSAKTTMVESALRPPNEQPRSLHDFVDEHGIDELTAVFRKCIDHTHEAQTRLTASNGELDERLLTLEQTLGALSSASHKDEVLHTVVNFNAIENHATEMANLLQSLVHHYDLCVKALKHIEGGNEAAVDAQADLPTDVSTTTIDRHAAPLPMSNEELTELMRVLEGDAGEVEDVVQEVREHAIEMESQSEMIADQAKRLQDDHAAIREAARLLDDLGASLEKYTDAASAFSKRWGEVRQDIEVNQEELEGLCDFYSGFLQAYHGLLLEVARRRDLQTRMAKIAQEAKSKLENLKEEDQVQRESFKLEHGEYLPKDIWPNLEDPAPNFGIQSFVASDEQVPDLPREILQQAVQRRHERHL